MRRAPSRGIYPFLTSTRRPYELQACYYAQGRLKSGESARYQGYSVSVSEHNGIVMARCGNELVRVPSAAWKRTITNAQPKQSWHTLGFAADFAFRSSPSSRDARYDLSLYRQLAKVFREVCSDVRWGNDWDADGIEVANDPDEHFSDRPHFEWHPGVTLGEVAAGSLPTYQKQCHECLNFRDAFRGETCSDCAKAHRKRASAGVK